MKKTFYSIFLILLVFMVASRANAQLTPPTLLTPVNNATGVSLFPTFTWTSVTGATNYRIVVATGPTTVLDVSNITTTSYTVNSAVLVGNTTYYWYIIASGSGGTGQSSSFYFTTAPAVPSPPNLSYPANNTTNMPLTFTFDWNDVTGAAWYQLQVSTSPTFSSYVLNLNGLTNSGYTVLTGVLSTNTTYYWRVNASNSGGTSEWSSVWNFTTLPTPPSAPTLSYPANGATNVPVSVTLKWRKISVSGNITNYTVQVSQNESFTQIVVNEYPTDTLFTIPTGTLSGSATYYWRVSATNAGGTGDYSSIWHFTTAIAPPAVPQLLTPTNSATGVAVTGVIFDWNSVTGANSYWIQISTSSDFGTTFVSKTTGSTSQYTHSTPAFSYNTTYYWRVNATNSGGTSAWSVVWSFTTVEATLSPPTLLSPANNSTNISLTPTLDWTDVSNATGYQLQVSTSSSFTSYVVNVSTTISGYTIPSGILQGYTKYYWRVASKNGGGTGSYSSAWNFTTVQTFNLNLKVYLEGFYNGTTQVVDTVKVYLAQNTSPFTLKDSSSAILGTDGTANTISFAKASSGTYYVVIKHRNHLETWSSLAMYFSTGNTVSYNFTDYASRAYGSNMKQVGTVWVLYGGDANMDGIVNSADYELYKAQFGNWGYKSCDFNGDGFIDGYDLPILNNNFGKSKSVPY
jgi:hypothetical protein